MVLNSKYHSVQYNMQKKKAAPYLGVSDFWTPLYVIIKTHGCLMAECLTTV